MAVGRAHTDVIGAAQVAPAGSAGEVSKLCVHSASFPNILWTTLNGLIFIE